MFKDVNDVVLVFLLLTLNIFHLPIKSHGALIAWS